MYYTLYITLRNDANRDRTVMGVSYQLPKGLTEPTFPEDVLTSLKLRLQGELDYDSTTITRILIGEMTEWNVNTLQLPVYYQRRSSGMAGAIMRALHPDRVNAWEQEKTNKALVWLKATMLDALDKELKRVAS